MTTPLPVLASIPAFIVYGINHSLDPAIVFTSLTLFNMLRLPLMFFRKLSPILVCVLCATFNLDIQQLPP